MITKSTLTKFGFNKDNNNKKLKEIFQNDAKLKESYIEIYPDNPLAYSTAPFMLLLRTIEKNIIVVNDDVRLILKKKIDNNDMCIVNVLFAEVTRCYYKVCDGYSEFIINIQNIYYRITIFN